MAATHCPPDFPSSGGSPFSTRTKIRPRDTSSIWSHSSILFTSPKYHRQKRRRSEKAGCSYDHHKEALKNHQSRKNFVNHFKSLHLYDDNEGSILDYYISCETDRLVRDIATEAVESYITRCKSTGGGSTSLRPSDLTNQAQRYTVTELSKQLKNSLRKCVKSIVDTLKSQAEGSDPIETVQSGIFGLIPVFNEKNGLSCMKSCTLVSGKDGEESTTRSITARKDRGRFDYWIFDDEIEDLIREGNRPKISACPWPVG